MLPKNKGRHPLIWAKVLGLEKTGATFFFMDEGADSGDILAQSEISIDFEDDINDLYQKVTNVALKQIEIFYPKLCSDSYIREKQIEEGNIWRKRTKIDGLIDFRMLSESIINLVRALTKPFPGAHCIKGGLEYKVWKCELGSNKNINIEPGKVLSIKGCKIEVKTSNSSIFLTEHNLPKISIGEYFEMI
jgi:methionyl-tRNA formyltransferase